MAGGAGTASSLPATAAQPGDRSGSTPGSAPARKFRSRRSSAAAHARYPPTPQGRCACPEAEGVWREQG